MGVKGRVSRYEPGVPCPSCGYHLDAVTDPLGRAKPRPGDMSVCLNCATPLVFDVPPSLHVMTDEELARLSEEEADDLMLAQRLVRQVGRGR